MAHVGCPKVRRETTDYSAMPTDPIIIVIGGCAAWSLLAWLVC